MSIQCCPPKGMAREVFTDSAMLFKALADPHRLTILATLARAETEVCVCDFTDGLPLNQPAVSHHLRILREADLVTCERRGTWVYYKLTDDALFRLDNALGFILQQKVIA